MLVKQTEFNIIQFGVFYFSSSGPLNQGFLFQKNLINIIILINTLLHLVLDGCWIFNSHF